MSSIELKGPFLLTAEKVKVAVTAVLPGAYVLGHTDDAGTFIVEKVGRSDDNLKKTLQDQVECFSEFRFEHFHSAKAAFEKECDLYHNFMVEMDYVHPTRLDGSYWKCPHCGVFD